VLFLPIESQLRANNYNWNKGKKMAMNESMTSMHESSAHAITKEGSFVAVANPQ
jgi:hypothetical protein